MAKTVDILLIVGCLGSLLDAFAGLIMPALKATMEQDVRLSALAELTTVLWLLVFEVKRSAKGKLTLVTA